MPQIIDSTSDDRTKNNVVRHEYRTLSDVEKKHMKALKDTGLEFLALIDSVVPKGREGSIAKTRVEEAVMWAVKGLTA